MLFDFIFKKKNTARFPVLEKKKIMTYYEYRLYKILQNRLKDKYVIFPQICVRSLFKGDSFFIPEDIRWCICDFVLFDSKGVPLKVIELNDKTHKDSNRIYRDNLLKSFLDSNNIYVWQYEGDGEPERFDIDMVEYIRQMELIENS